MSTDEKAPVKLSLPLDFQQDIFREVRAEDELVILARGLGLLRIVTNLLHSYDAAGNNLIILLGTDERENSWIGESLAEHAAISMSPKAKGLNVVTTELMNVGTREEQYKQGGIFSITSRILIVDYLSGLLNPAKVTGMIVLHAERVIATSLEAFILRIYRQHNKTGFLKAFSDQSESFTPGFAPLANMMRNLFLRKPSLWPRFQMTVAKSLEGKKKAEVIELEVPMTDAMKEIQGAVMECIDASIGELKKANTGLDMEDWNIDSALHRNFENVVRRQLDPVWHRTSPKTKQIVRDLSTLRNLLHGVLTYDAVQFQKYLDFVIASSSPPPGSTRQIFSPWLLHDAANTLISTSKRRVYTGKITPESDKNQRNSDSVTNVDSLQPVLEELPKWNTLTEVLQEIDRDNYYNPTITDDSNGTTLIMCGDLSTCHQLREYLRTMYLPVTGENGHQEQDHYVGDHGSEQQQQPTAAPMMRKKLRNYLAWQSDFRKANVALFSDPTQKKFSADGATDSKTGQSHNNNRSRAPPNKRRRVRGGGNTGNTNGSRSGGGHLAMPGDKDSEIARLMAEIQPNEIEAQQTSENFDDSLQDLEEEKFELYEMQDIILVHPYDGDMDDRVLEEVKPRYIIMYEPEPAFIRRVEVYRSSHTDRSVRVYFLYYGGSVEEQRYLSAVRREKDAFTKLIKERGSMSVTMTLDAHGVDDPQEHFLRTVNTRIAGGGRLAATSAPPIVVIDVREFRSSLPSLLHGRSMQTVPCTLTVGDYVLSPTICVERKSVRDLISSFSNGRLYNQAETMLQHYKSPFLLIEFDQNKSFTLEPFADLSLGASAAASSTSSLANLTPGASSDLQSKLVLLTLAFPRLKIIWSSSPYQTAEIFEELKKNQDEPSPLAAVRVGLEGIDPAAAEALEGSLYASTGAGEGALFTQAPQDMLRAVPGVTEANLTKLTLEVSSVAELANMDEDDISGLVGRESGRQIFRFFNRSVFDE